MKKVLIAAVAVMAVGAVVADISIDWKSGTGGAVIDAGGAYPAGPYLGEGAVVQLIWSTTPAVTAGGAYPVLGGALLADEVQLDISATVGGFGQGFAGGGIYGNADVGGLDVNSGYFYTRIHQRQGQSGDFFLDIPGASPVLTEYNPQDTGSVYSDDVLAGLFNIDGNGTTVIPEPATIGLMGIAGLGMYLARRKTRR
jgi:hypothetical protein